VIILVFSICAAFVVYTYVGYPLALVAIRLVRNRPVRRRDVSPTISFIIAAHNEERRIGAKLLDTLQLDYPPDLLEIIVASDCSTDGTHAIVEGLRSDRVRLVVSPERRGKEAAQKLAISVSSGQILVFSDVATRVDRHALRQVVRNFASSDVGCVSSVDRLTDAAGRMSGEGLYVRYEMLLRTLESSIGSVVGLSGSFFAARRDVCANWAVDVPSDFATLLSSVRLGLRGVSDPEVVGYYQDLADNAREYDRKVRTITRGIVALSRNTDVMNPFRYGLASWQIFSHKLCRWTVPFALAAILIASVLLIPASRVFAAAAAAQVVIYGMAIVTRTPPRWMFLRAVMFFVNANVAILHAWINVVRGRRFVVWEPSRRPDIVER
jgi:glycosyltransferase involved in cell wall biosynthesis